MKSEKFILQPGIVCTFDRNNLLKKDDTELIFVEIVEEIPKKNMFGPRWFKVIGTGDDTNKLKDPVEVPETLLSPSGMVVIRYPSDIPVINSNDIKALEDTINVFNYPPSLTVNGNNNPIVKRLHALKEKLEFYLRSMEV